MSLAEKADKTEARGRETPARILAETVKALGIRVSANLNIGGDFEVIPCADFEHENCEPTNPKQNNYGTKSRSSASRCRERHTEDAEKSLSSCLVFCRSQRN